MNNHKNKIQLKPEFIERMKKILSGEDFEKYTKSLETPSLTSIRCNTLKISPEELRTRLEKNGWKISQPWKNHKEVFVVESELLPGELGRSLEHLLGYYYIQDLASMLPVLVLEPKPNELTLDLCASPGSKTTQISASMENQGSVIANEVSLARIKILASNLERCGCANAVITKKEGIALCKKLSAQEIKLDKILVDAPCSGEGTLRSSPKTSIMWNPRTITSLSKLQKQMLESALEILKPNGTLVYSTCTHAPEENEEVLDYILSKHNNIKIESINLPIKTRPGVGEWEGQTFNPEVKKSCRIYPQDAGTEGFFVAKLRKVR
jgi:NOL1/NOP2/sun family putative RNA methylase